MAEMTPLRRRMIENIDRREPRSDRPRSTERCTRAGDNCVAHHSCCGLRGIPSTQEVTSLLHRRL